MTFVIAARTERGRTIDRVRALREHHPPKQVEIVVVFSESGPRAVWSSAFTVLEARLGATVLLHPAATTGPLTTTTWCQSLRIVKASRLRVGFA